MPGYIRKTFLKIQHPIPKNPEYALFKADPKQYEANVKFAKEEDDTPALSSTTIKLLQQRIGSLLFHRRVVYMTLLNVLITLASAQANVREAKFRAMVQQLNYCDMYPDAIIRYKQSNMILSINSYVS